MDFSDDDDDNIPPKFPAIDDERSFEDEKLHQLALALAYVQDNSEGTITITAVLDRANTYLHAMNRSPIDSAQVIALLEDLVERGIAVRHSHGTYFIKAKEGRKWRRQQRLKGSYCHGSPKPLPPPAPDEELDEDLLAGFLAALKRIPPLPAQ